MLFNLAAIVWFAPSSRLFVSILLSEPFIIALKSAIFVILPPDDSSCLNYLYLLLSPVLETLFNSMCNGIYAINSNRTDELFDAQRLIRYVLQKLNIYHELWYFCYGKTQSSLKIRNIIARKCFTLFSLQMLYIIFFCFTLNSNDYICNLSDTSVLNEWRNQKKM